ncbi:hypothetical protein OIV83_005419 [Microbotryomycetes sp. JL201]|nr:hypothetical protein OIV83_005419 [Microbotryomycetes sp. JL201]
MKSRRKAKASARVRVPRNVFATALKPSFIDILQFAGSELFAIDGDALVSFVLDNALLALGSAHDPSFQLLHATWLLENTLRELQRHDCSFDVVFFSSLQHTSILTGESPYVVESRRLAREVLKRRCNLPGVRLYSFESFADDEWIDYNRSQRPMFLLTHDGGLLKGSSFEVERVLLRRAALTFATGAHIPVALLQSLEYRQSRIMTYLYRPDKSHVPETVKAAAQQAQSALDDALPALPAVKAAGSTPADLLIAAVKGFNAEDAQDAALLYLFVAHTSLLETLPLNVRAQTVPKPSEALMAKIDSFVARVYPLLSAVVASVSLKDVLADFDIDGRIFYLLVTDIVAQKGELVDLLGPTVASKLQEVWANTGLSVPDFSALRSAFPSETSEHPPAPEATAETLLPVSNEVVDDYLKDVRVSISDASTEATIKSKLPSGTRFDDDSYWENPKPVLPTQLGSAPPVALDRRAKKKRDRQEQRFMAAMQKSAASLTGAMGSSLKQQVIPAVGKRSTSAKQAPKAPSQNRAPPAKGGKAAAAKPLTSKEKLLAENAAKKEAEERKENATWWDTRLAQLKPLAIPAQISLLQAYLKNKRASDRWLGTEMIVKRIDLELRKWIADDRRDEPEIADSYRVFIARTAGPLLAKAKKGLATINERQGKSLVSSLEIIGLGCLVPEGILFGAAAEKAAENGVNGKSSAKGKSGSKKDKDKSSKSKDEKEEKEDKGPKTFSFVSLSKGNYEEFMKIKEDPLEWQLRCMGEFMERELDSRPDPRVNFDPDAWQREVLDKIDRDESMLIIAPTSSGKTFISFAAMERVLRDSDDGVVIYVAPSKALVNQVAAEVFARFSKEVAGQSLWAIHTGDYKINNPQNCQVLVTVPSVFSEMLLNPALARVWTPRIRRVIIDEIHAIAEQGGGLWEQVLLMNPAPVIGLSATVGDPERFSEWLKSVESKSGRAYSMVKHVHRFNHLRKHAYAPTFPIKPIGPLNEHKPRPNVFAPVHPIAALALGEPLLPEDLALEPRDCLFLYKAMVGASDDVDPGLAPNVFFAKTPAVAIRDTIRYEAELKKIMVEWRLRDDYREPNSPFQKVVQALEAPLRKAVAEVEQKIEDGTDDDLYALFLPLLADLQARGDLPAIIFNFGREKVEALGKRILTDLEEAESRWREKSPAYKLKLQRAKEAEKLAAKRAKEAESAAKRKGGDDDDPTAAGADEEESSNLFDPDDPSEEFSFVGKGISQVEFKREIGELAWLNLDPWLINALRRGIGIHHSGLTRRYRVLVENLYRRGVLRVVISTETLALGINAPARTAIFGGDSIALNALNFRQCAGRAGRRGFDTLGNVLFVGVRLDRIERLLLSKLPKLTGTFPLTTTMVLRIQNLLWGSDYAPLAKQDIDTLMTIPRLAVNDAGERPLVHYFTRFALEYLRRMGLVDETGRPMNLYGMAATLYQHEPANYAFIALLRSGELHRLTSKLDSDRDGVLRELLTVLASLFGTVYRRKQSKETLRPAGRNSTSMIVLPPLPERIAAALRQHEQAITTIFAAFAKDYATQRGDELGEDVVLPLSRRKVKAVETADGAFASKLRQTAIPFEGRSAFVATSGHGDVFGSVTELVHTTREGVLLQHHALPDLKSPILGSDEHQLDAFVVDFYRHGSLDVLVRDNLVPRGQVWYILLSFDQALSGVQAAVEGLIKRKQTEMDDGNDSDADEPGRGPGEDEKEVELQRPAGVNDADWSLYRAVTELSAEFNRKFKAIYA